MMNKLILTLGLVTLISCNHESDIRHIGIELDKMLAKDQKTVLLKGFENFELDELTLPSLTGYINEEACKYGTGDRPVNYYACTQYCMFILDLVGLQDAPECLKYVKYMKNTLELSIKNYKKPITGNLPWLDKNLRETKEANERYKKELQDER